jgi:hypothetical protein
MLFFYGDYPLLLSLEAGGFLFRGSIPVKVHYGIVIELYKTCDFFGLGLPKGIRTLIAV